MRTFEMLRTYLNPQRRKVTLLGLLLLGSISLQIVNPLNLAAFLDAVTSGASYERLLLLAGFFCGLALFQQFIAVAAAYLGWELQHRRFRIVCRLSEPNHRLYQFSRSSACARTPGRRLLAASGRSAPGEPAELLVAPAPMRLFGAAQSSWYLTIFRARLMLRRSNVSGSAWTSGGPPVHPS